MGVLYEDAVLIKDSENPGHQRVVTVNCPDKTGLGRDLCRVILLFGLSIARGDISTDGKWCYLVFWVVGKPTTRWDKLKNRLLEVCPMYSPSVSNIYYYTPEFQNPKPQDVFLLKLRCSHDRKGLLHDVTKALCELELTIKRVKASTAPDGRVMDLFFLTDTRELLHTAKRQEETICHLKAALGETTVSCEIDQAGPELVACLQVPLFLPSEFTEDLFCLELESEHRDCLDPFDPVTVMLDNSLSPSHTLLHVLCRDHKGLIYDIMRTLKDYNIQIAYGRFAVNPKGNCAVDLFIVQADKKKIIDPEKQNALSSRLRMELVHPLRVNVLSRGPDTELLVSNPVELSGRGRPLVFYDTTLALKILDISIFSVGIVRHRIHDREWEVYRILLDECDRVALDRDEIKECVRRRLMGWE